VYKLPNADSTLIANRLYFDKSELSQNIFGIKLFLIHEAEKSTSPILQIQIFSAVASYAQLFHNRHGLRVLHVDQTSSVSSSTFYIGCTDGRGILAAELVVDPNCRLISR
jgi:hypothetical protein